MTKGNDLGYLDGVGRLSCYMSNKLILVASRRGETKWLMRQTKMRDWVNWVICQPFKLTDFLNIPFLFFFIFCIFRSFVLRNASFFDRC